MDCILILVAGLIATSIMTLFSYIVAEVKSSQFREPELLNILMTRTKKIPLELTQKSILGWMVHYVIGWLFVMGMDLVWRLSSLNPSVETGAFLGFAAGIVGVIGWEIMFYINPHEPRIEFKKFYLQLLIAHIIFGMSAGFTYQIW